MAGVGAAGREIVAAETHISIISLSFSLTSRPSFPNDEKVKSYMQYCDWLVAPTNGYLNN